MGYQIPLTHSTTKFICKLRLGECESTSVFCVIIRNTCHIPFLCVDSMGVPEFSTWKQLPAQQTQKTGPGGSHLDPESSTLTIPPVKKSHRVIDLI